VRIFEDENIIHVDGKINPLGDIEVINLELILADIQTVTKRLQNLARGVKQADKVAIAEHEALTKINEALQAEKLASSVALSEIELPLVKSMHLLTMKPMLFVLNKKGGGKNLDEINDERYQKLLQYLQSSGAGYVIVDARIEEELKDLAGEEKEMFRNELGGKDDGINNLIVAGYKLLNLITYFTTGEKETRAWTILKGWNAPMAGTAIHTDFKDKFVRAEIIEWDKLIEAGSYGAAREKGLVRTEGKDYIVKDGDVIEFKI